jgi:hypothetical protein
MGPSGDGSTESVLGTTAAGGAEKVTTGFDVPPHPAKIVAASPPPSARRPWRRVTTLRG